MSSSVSKPLPIDGLLLVYKPKGVTSKDVSRWFQRRLGKIKMGHVGTLDPIAEGLLPVLFGKATRVQDFLLSGTKAYEFDVNFGSATDTLDADGEIVAYASCEHVTETQLKGICKALIGDFLQTPPIYSAIKFKGKPLYEYARKGKSDQIPLHALSKVVKVEHLECLNFAQDVGTFRIRCEKGTYVRVVASRIAELASTLGTITRLLRLGSGKLDLRHALTLEQIEADLDQLNNFIIPIENIDLSIPFWRSYDEVLIAHLKMGQEVQLQMTAFENGLASNSERSAAIRSLDHVILIDNNGRTFGIGSALVLDTGRIAVRMRRGL